MKKLMLFVAMLFALATNGYGAPTPMQAWGTPPGTAPAAEELNAEDVANRICSYVEQVYHISTQQEDYDAVYEQVVAEIQRAERRDIDQGETFVAMDGGVVGVDGKRRALWYFPDKGKVWVNQTGEDFIGIALRKIRAQGGVVFDGLVITEKGRQTGRICYNLVAKKTWVEENSAPAPAQEPVIAPAPQAQQERVLYVGGDGQASLFNTAVLIASSGGSNGCDFSYKGHRRQYDDRGYDRPERRHEGYHGRFAPSDGRPNFRNDRRRDDRGYNRSDRRDDYRGRFTPSDRRRDRLDRRRDDRRDQRQVRDQHQDRNRNWMNPDRPQQRPQQPQRPQSSSREVWGHSDVRTLERGVKTVDTRRILHPTYSSRTLCLTF